MPRGAGPACYAELNPHPAQWPRAVQVLWCCAELELLGLADQRYLLLLQEPNCAPGGSQGGKGMKEALRLHVHSSEQVLLQGNKATTEGFTIPVHPSRACLGQARL